MKIVFTKKETGMELALVECDSLDEADTFAAWYTKRADVPVSSSDSVVVEAAAATGAAAPEPATFDSLKRVALDVMRVKGREAVEEILKRNNAKRISDLPADSLDAVQAEFKAALV